MTEMSGSVVVLVTHNDADRAKALARDAVDQRLAACVNLVPGLTSIYRWEGRIEEDAELLMIFKTRRERVDALREAVTAAHPYANPEFVVLPIESGSPAYLRWIDAMTLSRTAD